MTVDSFLVLLFSLHWRALISERLLAILFKQVVGNLNFDGCLLL